MMFDFPEVNILLVEDNESDQISIQRTIKKLNSNVKIKITTDIDHSIEALQSESFDVILLDYFIGQGSGLELLPIIPRNIPIIFISGHGDQEVISNALGEGAYNYLLKDMELSYLNLLGPTIQNVLTRKHSEEQSKQHMLELERSNAELFAFSKNVSTALKDPLSKLRIFQEEILKAIDFESQNLRHLFSLTETSIQKMESKIESLFEYSKINCDQEMFVEVDLNNLLNDVADVMRNVLENESVILNIQPLPIVNGNPFLLRKMFEKVIQNSILFRKKNQPVGIDIQHENENGFSLVEIRDNGIGFEPENRERIFDPFERLNPDSPGIGMGLATCKRIIHVHGGKISADAKPGEGTVIILQFPRQER